MENFKEVSLGFSEFISQLLRETFDSVLSTQSYQVERYAQLEKMLNLSDATFAKLHISPEEKLDKEEELFGIELIGNSTISAENQRMILEEVDASEGIFSGDKLTSQGVVILRQFALDLLVIDKKSTLNYLLNKSDGARIIVDSGEINAKLELSNLYSSNSDTSPPQKELPPDQQAENPGKEGKAGGKEGGTSGKKGETSGQEGSTGEVKPGEIKPGGVIKPGSKTKPGGKAKPVGKAKPSRKSLVEKMKIEKLKSAKLASGKDKIETIKEAPKNQIKRSVKTKEIINPATKGSVILIDKSEIKNVDKTDFSIPSVRIIAKPVSMTSSSNLFTEVKIRFKTV